MRPDGIKRKAFFDDVTVRRAMAYLTPVDEIVEVLLHGEGSRQVSNLSNLKKNYNDTLELIPLDVDKAKSLLDEAAGQIVMRQYLRQDGERIAQLTFQLSYMSSLPPRKWL